MNDGFRNSIVMIAILGFLGVAIPIPLLAQVESAQISVDGMT